MSSSLSLAVVRRRKGHSERVHALLQKNRRTFDMKFFAKYAAWQWDNDVFGESRTCY